MNTTSSENTRVVPLKSPKPRITQPSVRMYRTDSNDVEGILDPNDGHIADLQDVGKSNEVSHTNAFMIYEFVFILFVIF